MMISLTHMILVLGVSEFLLFHLLTATKTIRAFLSRFQPSTYPSASAPTQQIIKRSVISRGDAHVVLRSLGMCVEAAEQLPESVDLVELFEEESPSLREVKEAFDVFDANRDGFIDAAELHNVLCCLGLREGLTQHDCARMIGLLDEDGDGDGDGDARIDFDEFVRFMDNALC
ncbi:probable calcium-binding protein CML46 [Salvia miltiorrhiza]|uniref:probable calcium-binding protein CML46 n=1 Tax=Salvia miltiorrhiza TaxID=226208 RepID=UPI0025AC2BC7|nr:probable calcium-binding protein CML46 [Salvia miltiorrhiza]